MRSLFPGIGYAATIDDLITTPTDQVVGQLLRSAATRLDGATEHLQARAWSESIDWAKDTFRLLVSSCDLAGQNGMCFEYEIPRRNYRIDCVALLGDLIIPIEFKSSVADRAAIRQVEDYGLELSTFHLGSRDIPDRLRGCYLELITRFRSSINVQCLRGISCGSGRIGDATIHELLRRHSNVDHVADWEGWARAPYSPTPTIIEAASSLFRGHTLEEIARSDASVIDLKNTVTALEDIVENAIRLRQKTICFITGVPGAVKTLAGLSAVHGSFADKSVFLSGNGPLVKVLARSLENDLYEKSTTTREEARRSASAFISNVHNCLTEYVERDVERPPHENIVVFDEAQRAWNRQQSKSKFGRDFSEPDGMLRIMDRHDSWCVLIELIGGGQEINSGEAGLAEWGSALASSEQDWIVHAAPQAVHGDSSTAGSRLFDDQLDQYVSQVIINSDLHLSVSQRTFRNSNLNSWVESVLNNDSAIASETMKKLTDYPVNITRDLPCAKRWLRNQARGWRSSGLVASSGAKRLRAHGLAVDEPISDEDWFLKPHGDVRSSNQLEAAATEFAVQGLELDWVGVCWGADLRYDSSEWTKWQFRGAQWQSVRANDRLKFISNRYRVLLTRAREGFVIFIPHGDKDDATRPPEFYDHTYQYLLDCGARPLPEA